MQRAKIKHLLQGLITGMALVAVALTVWLGVAVAGEFRRAAWLERVNTLADEVLLADASAAKERGLTAASLPNPEAATQAIRERMAALRAEGDRHYARVITIAGTLVVKDPSHPLSKSLSELTTARSALEQARRETDQRLAGQPTSLTVGQWATTITDFISALAQVRRDGLLPSGEIEKALNDNAQIKEIVYLASENAGRERAMIGNAIAVGRPLNASEQQQLAHVRGIVEDSLDRLNRSARRLPSDTPLAVAVGRLNGEFLGHFQKLRESVYQASDNHRHYPVNSVQWYDAATAGIDSILAVGEEVSRETGAQVGAVRKQQVRKTMALGVAVIVILSILAAATWIVQQRVIRPLNRMVAMLQDIATGDGDLSRRVAIVSQDEIGEMAHWINDFIDHIARMVTVAKGTASDVAHASQQLSSAAQDAASATHEVSYTVGDLADGSSSQAEQVTRGYEEAQRMSRLATQVADNTVQAARATAAAATAAEAGQLVLDGAVSKVQALQATIAGSTRVINDLEEHATQIDGIVELIKGIAAQTNLLALNAAIEAARAGEHGRGFTIVADEVRKLAGESAHSAKNITERIAEIQRSTREAAAAMATGGSETDQTVILINEASHSISEISSEVQQANQAVTEISGAIERLHQGLQSLTSTIEQVAAVAEAGAAGAEMASDFTKEQNASIEEIAASVQSLAEMAESLHGLVGRFHVEAAANGHPADAPAKLSSGKSLGLAGSFH